MTWNRSRYPDDWEEIAEEVKEAAGWRCEHCGHPHEPETGYTLTVHHLDGNPQNCARENLLAACQRCHLRIQARYHPESGMHWLPGLAPRWAVERGLA